MRTGVFSLIFAVIAVGCLSAPADARPPRDPQSLDQILPQIRDQHPGTFYDAEGPFTGPDGQAHYRIKWKTPQGRVIWFNADARTGHVTNGDGPRRDFYDGPRDRGDGPDPDRERGRRHRNRFDGDGGNPFGGDDDGPRRGGGWDRPGGGGDHGDRGGWRNRGNGGWGGWPGGGGQGGGGQGNGHHGHGHGH